MPSAYDLNSAGQFEQSQKLFLPSADSCLRRPSCVQADRAPGRGCPGLGHAGQLEGRAVPELTAASTITRPHARPTPTLKKKSQSHYLRSFLGSTQKQQSKGFATNFPRSTDFPAAREGPMTKPVRSQKQFSTNNLTFCCALSLPLHTAFSCGK